MDKEIITKSEIIGLAEMKKNILLSSLSPTTLTLGIRLKTIDDFVKLITDWIERTHQNKNFVYICYEAGNRNIKSITDNVRLARKICCNNDDAYVKIEVNKDYSNKNIDTTNIAIYNLNGKYRKLKKCEKQ